MIVLVTVNLPWPPPTAVGCPPTAVRYPVTAVGYPLTGVDYPATAALCLKDGSDLFLFCSLAPPRRPQAYSCTCPALPLLIFLTITNSEPASGLANPRALAPQRSCTSPASPTEPEPCTQDYQPLGGC